MALVPVQVREAYFLTDDQPVPWGSVSYRPLSGVVLDPTRDRTYVDAEVGPIELQDGVATTQLLTVDDDDEPRISYEVVADLGRATPPGRPLVYRITLPRLAANPDVVLELSDRDETTGEVALPGGIAPPDDDDTFGDVF